jgi:ABC-2 type transport system ATP-binding protein
LRDPGQWRTYRHPSPPSVQKIQELDSLSYAIEIDHLVKRYGDFTAVDDVSFAIDAGEFFGFLGPNGAGKTTTINAIVGLAKITGGSIAIFGHDNVHDWRTARRLVGLAPQEYNFDRYLSIRDVLIYQAGYLGLRGPAVRARADELLERFDLTSKAKTEYVRLSGGMKRRLSLARAMIHEPQLLILDEPTAGVDVELRIELWALLRELNASGITILLTTHYLEEAEALCRRIGIIERGRIVALERTEDLVGREGENRLIVTIAQPLRALPPELAARGARLSGPTTIEFDGIAPAHLGAALDAVAQNGMTVVDVAFSRSTLQDVFLELTRR